MKNIRISSLKRRMEYYKRSKWYWQESYLKLSKETEEYKGLYEQQKQRADKYESLYEKVKDAIVHECSLVDGMPEMGLRHVRDEVGTNENNMEWYEEWNK